MDESNLNKKPKIINQCVWREKSKLERNLIISLIFIIALFIALLLFVIIKPAVMKRKCITKDCLIAASEIIQKINPEVDPCKDFAKFACGHERIKNDKTQNTEEDLLDILRESIDENDHPVFKNQKKLYQSCLEDNDNNLAAINSTIAELGWPVVVGYQWHEETFDWQQLIFKLRKTGYPFEMMLQIKVVKEGPAYTIKVLPPKVKNITESIELYKQYMTNVAVFFGADTKRAENEMEKVFYFALHLKKISDLHSGSISTTVRNYLEDNADIDWLNYINNILYPVNQLILDDYAQFPRKEFTNQFHNLIYRTPKRVIANYIIWNALESSMPFMPKILRTMRSNYECQTKKTNSGSRETFCKNTLQSLLPVSMHIVYARRHISKTKRIKIKTLFDDIRDEFINILEKSWLDDLSSTHSANILKNCVEVIGMPGDYFNDSIFHETSWPGDYNKGAENGSFFEIILSQNRKYQNDKFYKLRRKGIQNNIYRLITSMNVSYDLTSNAIILPVAVLPKRNFGENRPMYLNYGMLGNIIGSELIRAIIRSGREYNKNGDENSSWSESARTTYNERIRCFMETSNNLQDDLQQLKLNNTIEDVIIDYTGIQLAYSAYKNWTKSNKRESYLNGINYNSKQLFWISSVSRHCSNFAPETINLFSLLENNSDFARDFNCPTTNVSKICQIF